MGRRRKAEGHGKRYYLPLSFCQHFLPFLPCATAPQDKNIPLLHTDLSIKHEALIPRGLSLKENMNKICRLQKK